jgi:polyhydroxyalkanoate synthesis regulator phasin
MANEPDNLVLQSLRDICATQAEHTRMHAEHRQSFVEIREELRGANNNAVYAAGFAVLGRRDNDTTGERVTKLEARVQRIEEKLDG